MKGFPDLPPIWWVGSILAIYIGKWAVPGLHLQSGLLKTVPWPLLVVALVIGGWSVIWFRRKQTPIEPRHTPEALIVEGPYRLSRNPIYLAFVLLTLASAIGNGSLIGLLSAALLWWVLDRRFAAKEEALLVQTFGDQARAYLNRTRRWI